jgi:hypothetical protein
VDQEARKELEATVAARRELGAAHDDELIAGFLERIEKEIDRRVDQRLGRRGRHNSASLPELGIAVPLLIIAGIFGGAWGLAAVAAALALIFMTIISTRR